MATWERIRDEIAGMLADGQSLEEVIGKLEKRKNEMKKPKPMTNEEWLHTLNTEQLAEVLDKMTLSCYICGQDGYNENSRHCIFGRCTGKEDIFEWLKQPHTPKE